MASVSRRPFSFSAQAPLPSPSHLSLSSRADHLSHPLPPLQLDRDDSSHFNLPPLRPNVSAHRGRTQPDFECTRNDVPGSPQPQPPSPVTAMQGNQSHLYLMPTALSGASGSSSSSYAPPQQQYSNNGGGLPVSFQDLLYNTSPYPQPGFPTTNSSDPNGPESQWSRGDGEVAQVGPAEYAQAVDIWRHVRAALPHVRSMDSPGPPANGQPYHSLFEIANTAVCVLTGMTPKKIPATRPAPHPLPEASTKRVRLSNGANDKDKPATYCRGCGATETPEWRRGPLGPRTLCNACGLVHMKMMRKKKKAEEKAAAEAAAKGG